MNIFVDNYTFDKSTRQITFTDYASIRLDKIHLVVNVTAGVVIFNMANSALTGTVATNVLTLTYNTSAMNNTDKLTISYDDTSAVESVSQHAATPPASTTMQNAVSGNADGTSLPVTGYAVAILNVTASVAMSGGTTINFEASVDDTTWVAITGTQIGVTGSLATTTTTTGDYRLSVAGYKSVRARISAYSAGTITIKGYASPVAGPTHAVSVDAGSGAGSVIGATSGSAVTGDSNGTLQQYLRGLSKIANDEWDSTNHWLRTRPALVETWAAATGFTISLNSLASSTAGVGRQSTLLTGNTSPYALINCKFKMGTTPTAQSVVSVYLLQGDGTTNVDSAGASDAGLTVTNARLLGQVVCGAATTGLVIVAEFHTKDVIASLGPVWGVAVVNSTGAALDGSAGGTITYQLVS